MYLVAIAWMYVVLMMAAAEATNANGTVLGAFVTFTLYGVLAAEHRGLPAAHARPAQGAPARRGSSG